jgi:hypothetical protein
MRTADAVYCETCDRLMGFYKTKDWLGYCYVCKMERQGNSLPGCPDCRDCIAMEGDKDVLCGLCDSESEKEADESKPLSGGMSEIQLDRRRDAIAGGISHSEMVKFCRELLKTESTVCIQYLSSVWVHEEMNKNICTEEYAYAFQQRIKDISRHVSLFSTPLHLIKDVGWRARAFRNWQLKECVQHFFKLGISKRAAHLATAYHFNGMDMDDNAEEIQQPWFQEYERKHGRVLIDIRTFDKSTLERFKRRY